MTDRGQTSAALEARGRASDAKIRRLDVVLAQMERESVPIVRSEVARRSGVSRTFLYQNEEAQRRVEAASARSLGNLADREQVLAAQANGAWQERARNAEAELARAMTEIRAQRGQIADLLGAVRAFEDEVAGDDVHRIRSENLTLRRRVAELEGDHVTLQQRLSAARENARFLDKKVADLEGEVLHLRETRL